MKIEITPISNWQRVVDAARWTMNKGTLGKEPSDTFKHSILIAEHSPIRLLEYDIKLSGIPNKVMSHLVRHHQGVEKFVGTHRADRTEFTDESVTRLTPTNLWYTANAQGLINTSYKRLCYAADKDTVKTWKAVKAEMQKVDSIVASKMVPQCIRCGRCVELKSCGFYKTEEYKKLYKEYWNEGND